MILVFRNTVIPVAPDIADFGPITLDRFIELISVEVDICLLFAVLIENRVPVIVSQIRHNI